jgi:amino acid adenylation domain-containing protein
LSLPYPKQSTDASVIRFLPDDGLSISANNAPEIRAVRTIALEEVRSLRKAAERMGVTLENLLLAGFASLLSRLTGQGLLAIAVDTSGMAVFHLEEDASFRAILDQSSNRKPESEPAAQTSEARVRFQFLPDSEADTEYADCGLQLLVKENGSLLELASSLGLWRGDTLRGWLSYLLALVKAASKDPRLAVDRLPLWDDSEGQSFYASLNQTAVEFPGETSVPGRFAVQATQRPEATAVISASQRYTYRELEERSTELARRLVTLGAKPNRAVAVCMERSADLLLSLLAVLKSGAYYVPLDPHNPTQRLRSILEECNPVCLLSDSTVAGSLAGQLKIDSLPVLCVDQPRVQTEGMPALPAQINPADPAYTIYTSGTTGKPKGVRIRHEALLNLVCSMWRKPGISHTDRTLAVAPISFDIATMDMFLPICSGGTLVIASRQDTIDPYRLGQLLKEHDITFMQATPATWRMLITSGWSGKRNLKMLSGGEALPRELANDLLRHGGALWNCYGPTETTIYSGVSRIEPGPGIVPVGQPIANTSFYVMDQAGHLLPPGVAGELYIGGIGVSPGYVDRPELTAERFVPDRFTPESDLSTGSLFATGDLVRVVNGNELEFFGRLDHQVKLRGFRIELEEIESVLRTHPSITDAVVVLREDVPDEPRLVAYVVCSGPRVDAATVREHVAQSLPEYMLPSLAVILDQFPLSASGKINRQALPAPELVPRQIAASHTDAEPAADELEAKLLRIFREVLRNESIGVTNNFFLYGGYSLLTVRLFSRIDHELNIQLPISLLFDAPTVRDLAHVIRKGISPSIIVPIRPYGRSTPVFLVQSYLLYDAILELVEVDRPVYGVREIGDEREPISLEDRARRFAREILAAHPHGPLYLAGWCAAGPLTVEIARQLRETGHKVGLVALFDAERPGFALPSGLMPRTSRLWKKIAFHSGRLRRSPWKEKIAYISEALTRNWDWAVESYYTANHRTMLWLQRQFGLSFSEAAFNNVYASIATLTDVSIRPYPGKLSLFRAADVPSYEEIDLTLGWTTIALGGVKVDFVPGDHVSMFKKPNNRYLAQRLQQELHEYEANAVHT